MSNMTNRRTNIITAAIIAAVAFLGFAGLARAGNGNGNGRRRPLGPSTGPGGAKTWGTPGSAGGLTPPFDPTGAGLFVSDDCNTVIEGAKFWPANAPIDRNPPKEGTPSGYKFDPATAQGRACVVRDVRGLAGSQDADCTGLDYVDGMILDAGIQDPIEIAQSIARQVAPLCWDAPEVTWPEVFAAWYDSLVQRLVSYVERKVAWLEG